MVAPLSPKPHLFAYGWLPPEHTEQISLQLPHSRVQRLDARLLALAKELLHAVTTAPLRARASAPQAFLNNTTVWQSGRLHTESACP